MNQTSGVSGQSLKDVIGLLSCPGNLEIGDYVFGTRWSDADWNDPWCVGFIAELGKNYVTLSNENGSSIANVGHIGFRYGMLIIPEQGKRIVSEYGRREGDVFVPKIASKIIFDT